MPDVNAISNIEQKNDYNIKSSKNTNSNHNKFSSYLGETNSLNDIFESAAKKYNVSVDLLKAIGKAESNFNTKAVSRSGAQGVMQLMPATAKYLGVSDSFDATQNIMGGSKYIASLLKKYNGDEKLALAAYNAGSGNVAKYGGIPPFKETQNYVVKVMNYKNDGVENATSLNVVKTGAINAAIAATINSTATTISSTSPTSTTTNTTNTTSENTTTTTIMPPTNDAIGIITSDLQTSGTLIQDLDEIFSYDKYLSFLNQILEDDKKKDTEDEQSYYGLKQINYNVPVMNILNSLG